MKLKLNLSLMEDYERHCPQPQRRYNCLIPPPLGYKISITWPMSRDQVWKANIPHTQLAQEKSDQNWMVVDAERSITHFDYGADIYIAAIAVVRLYGLDQLKENQIQFALERGIAATLGVLGTRRLPYPRRSFELLIVPAVELIGFKEMVFFCWNWKDCSDQEAILFILHPKLMHMMRRIKEFGA